MWIIQLSKKARVIMLVQICQMIWEAEFGRIREFRTRLARVKSNLPNGTATNVILNHAEDYGQGAFR